MDNTNIKPVDVSGANFNFNQKLTQQHINGLVNKVNYVRAKDSNVTLCTIKTHTGFNAVGTSSTIHDCNFDAAKGESTAFKEALSSLWELEGYTMKTLELLINTADSDGDKVVLLKYFIRMFSNCNPPPNIEAIIKSQEY